jgi:hypothetical protein
MTCAAPLERRRIFQAVANVAELADAQDLGSCPARGPGSTPGVRIHSKISQLDNRLGGTKTLCRQGNVHLECPFARMPLTLGQHGADVLHVPTLAHERGRAIRREADHDAPRADECI